MRSFANTLFPDPSVLTRPPAEPISFGKPSLGSFLGGARPQRRHCAPIAAGRGGRQDLNDKAYKTGENLRHRFLDGYSKVDEVVRNGYSEVDRRFHVGEKAGDVANRVREQAKDVDQKFGLRQRIRLFRDDVQRKWPAVQRRWKAFSGSQLGSFTITAGVCYLFISGIAFRILNVLLGLFLLAPIGLTLLSSYNARRARGQGGQQQQQQQARTRAQAQNPFAGFSQRRPFAGQSRGPGRPQQPRKESPSDGPVIDAEWETIDDR